MKLFGAGLDSPTLTDTLSKLVGDHDVTTTSVSTGGGGRNGGGGRTQNTSVTRERILSAGDVRNLPKGCALLLATGHRPAMLQLQPWYRGPHKDAVTAALKAVAAQAAADLAATRAAAAAAAVGKAAGDTDPAVPVPVTPAGLDRVGDLNLVGDLDVVGVPVDAAADTSTAAPAVRTGAAAPAPAGPAAGNTAAVPAAPPAAAAIDWDTLDWEALR